MSIKKHFISFLVARGVLDQHLTNMQRSSSSNCMLASLDEVIDYENQFDTPEDILADSFYWRNSVEGYDFWDEVNDAWDQYCAYFKLSR